MCQSSEEQQFRIFALGLDAYLYIAKFLFQQQIYCINLKGTVSASSLFSSRQLATCSSRPPRRGGGVRSRASSTPNCILEWKIRSPAGNKVLNNSSIDELLNQTGSSEKLLEVHQSLNSNSISLAKLLKGVELSYEPNVKLLDAMQACHQFALTGDYIELVKVYVTAQDKRLSTALLDPLQSVKQAQAEMVALTQQATHIVVPSSPVQEQAQAILDARGERNDNTLKNAQEEQVERKNQSRKL